MSYSVNMISQSATKYINKSAELVSTCLVRPRFDLFIYSYTADSPELDRLIEYLIADLQLKRPKKHSKVLRAVLVNLIYMQHDTVGLFRGNITVPKRANPDCIGQTALRTVLDTMSDAGLIVQNIGSKQQGCLTLIRPTEKLLSMLRCRDLRPYWEGGNLELITRYDPIRLKNRNKKAIDYIDTEYTIEVRSFLHEYEEFLSNIDIVYRLNGEDISISYPFNVRRTFNNASFELGGRISAPWTSIPSFARSTIEIDGERTVEIDMPSSTINLLYRLATGHGYTEGDAYFLSVDGLDVPRKFIKAFLTIAQNTRSVNFEEAYFNYLEEKKIKDEFLLLGVSLAELRKNIAVKHGRIWHLLFKPEIGMKIQWSESELIYLVLRELTRRGIPSLSVYDSIIVKKSDERVGRKVLDFITTQGTCVYLRNLADLT